MLIHSGDFTNSRDLFTNTIEFICFVDWLKKVRDKFKYVVMVAGNHDMHIEKYEKGSKKEFGNIGAHLLINESVEIEGIKIWGSPCTPAFHDWAYNRDRGKIGKTWARIPDDTQILVTHGPPKGILDLSENRKYELEQCGDSALMSRIEQLKELRLFCCGHIHSMKPHYSNDGMLIRKGILYSNASCITDREFHRGLSSQGNLFNFTDGKATPIF
jgi:Icc-related predicted phosphoesterase